MADADKAASPSASPAPASAPGSEAVTSSSASPPGAVPSSGPWQAVYSPQYNAYYFYNSETKETTWENPLVKLSNATAIETKKGSPEGTSEQAEPESSTSSSTSYSALQQAAIVQGIDPSLAHLDPSLASSATGSGAYAATAKFNAHTGHFTRADARDPSHLSEYERAKRMSEFYFDVNAWESQRAREQEEEAEAAANGSSKKRKRLSKKDLERFKEQKKQKKIAKTAWLRT